MARLREHPAFVAEAATSAEEADINRRDFLKVSSATLAGIVAGQGIASAQEAAGGMQYRDLGKTGLKVSEIGMGTVTATSPAAIQRAVEKGITLFHTCLTYAKGRSIEAFGEVLKNMKSKREKIVLALKGVGDFDTALQTLNTDYVDIYLPPLEVDPSNRLMTRIPKETTGPVIPGVTKQAWQLVPFENSKMQETMEAVKKSGKARFCGLVAHKDMKNVSEAAMKVKYLQVILFPYNLANKAEVDPQIKKAKEAGIGFLAMKTRQGLQKGQDIGPVIKTLLENKDVDSILITQPSVQDVDKAVGYSGKKLTMRERREVFSATRLMLAMGGVCGFCARCEGVCPKGLAIPDIFRFHMYATRYEAPQHEMGFAEYRSLGPTAQATLCDGCGKCEHVCPNAVPIRQRLKEAHSILA
jgi:predicted aldo/keto reductase-like oxidoreductase